jgi:diguanylate cyclase (GGDEF)-like protein
MPPAVTAELRRAPLAGHGTRVRTALVLVLIAAIPVLGIAWIAGIGLGKTETNRTDVRLESEVRAAATTFVSSVKEANARARTLASSSALQQALATRDRAEVKRLIRPNEVVYAGQTPFVGTPDPDAVQRSARVTIDGAPLGAVFVNVPLNGGTLAHLRAAARVDATDRLALVEGSRTIAGALQGAAAAPLERIDDVVLAGTPYRTFAVRLVGSPTPVNLVIGTPRSAIGNVAHRRRIWTLLAIVLTLATVAALGYLAAPLIARHDGAHRVLGGSRDDERALTLVGDALASTHNPDKLLPVILHATMDATGAVGGRVLQDGRVTAEEGEIGGHSRPLTLVLGEDDANGETILQLWPPERSFDGRTRALAQSLAAQAAIALDNARLHTIVQRQAITDELTDLANRRRFMETLETERRRAERFGEPLALVFADLDDFKRVNDRHGHQVGDDVLRAFADVLRRRVRVIDVAARLGGEEFAILLVGTDLHGAHALAESLREAVSALEIRAGRGAFVRITASFGVTAHSRGQSSDALLEAADLALYRAKNEGKDRVRSEPKIA